ncbi:MAG: alpha/beta hydrolase [Cyclobacteriaceae bacterium]
MSQRIIFISGLGANELAFSRIGDVGLEKVLVKWIANERKESMESYAKRLIAKYKISSQDVITGLSFGGILAQQIGLILGNKNIILISSFRDKRDLRWPFKLALDLRLNIIPLIRIPVLENAIALILNSGSTESKEILKTMIKATDYKLMNWSIQKIAQLQNNQFHELNPTSLIGTRDRIIQKWSNNDTSIIQNGSHFMVFDRAREITEIIKNRLYN